MKTIAEAKRPESASGLRASEIRYRRLFEAARDGILILDPGTRKITDANPFMSELLDYPHEELMGKELWEIGLLKDEEASRAAFRELQEKQFIRYEDLPLQTKAGTRRDVEFVSNIYEEDGWKVIQCNIRDITGRKRAEEALQLSEERFRALFELGPVAVYSCDASGVIHEFNRRAAELWGRTPAVGETDERFCGSYKLFRPDGSFMTHEQCPMAEVATGKISAVRDAEALIERPDGSRVIVIVNIPAERQVLARHYGVHPYFTRRPANVVRSYIERYSEPGDTVADPFGGTGVTAIEALLTGRMAIHNDLNPFANFITANIADLSLPSTVPLKQAFQRIEATCAEKLKSLEFSDEHETEKLLRTQRLPTNIRLPKNSDAEFFYDLFTARQLAGLAILKKAIDAEKDEHVGNLLLLAWSASVAKLNKTFLSAEGRAESRGGSSIFSIYRYKLANRIVELPVWETFRGRFLNVLAAKNEVFQARDHFNQTHSAQLRIEGNKNLKVLARDAANLTRYLKLESVDYIFTDPPYGAHIAYLDLSILWNHWLGFSVSEETRKTEIIVGGECDLSEEHYKKTLAKSIHECLDLLKPDRWFSIVFQHWDATYFATILESVSEKGAELKAAVTQDRDVIWSMHKKKNSESVLSGEMILTFYKPGKRSKTHNIRPAPQRTPKTFGLILDEVLGEVSRTPAPLTSEFLFNRVILAAWKQNCLSVLSLSREDFATHLRSRGWQYNPKTHQWSIAVLPQDELVLYESVGAYGTAPQEGAKSEGPSATRINPRKSRVRKAISQ